MSVRLQCSGFRIQLAHLTLSYYSSSYKEYDTTRRGTQALIYWLEWDEATEEHLDAHGVSIADVWEVLRNEHITYPNHDEGEDRIYLLGRDEGGRILKISLAPTNDEGTWRPVTGFPATPGDINLFHRYVR